MFTTQCTEQYKDAQYIQSLKCMYTLDTLDTLYSCTLHTKEQVKDAHDTQCTVHSAQSNLKMRIVNCPLYTVHFTINVHSTLHYREQSKDAHSKLHQRAI